MARHELKGKRIHDVHLLASLIANGVPEILTANPGDFPREPGVVIVTPMTFTRE